jgi:DNA-binding IclR family transcriptional regulator
MPKKEDSVRSIDRAFDILQCFSKENTRLILQDVATRCGLHPTTALRLIRTLEKRKFLFRHGDRSYSLGIGAFALGKIAEDFFNPRKIVYSYMSEIWGLTQETVSLYGPENGCRMCYESVKSPHVVRCAPRVGKTFPLWAGASGRALLAFLGDEVISKELKKIHLLASNTITDPEKLSESLEEVRKNRYAYSLSEQDDGVRAVAVPIFNTQGDVMFSLAVYGPSERFSENKALDLIPKLQKISKEITDLIG